MHGYIKKLTFFGILSLLWGTVLYLHTVRQDAQFIRLPETECSHPTFKIKFALMTAFYYCPLQSDRGGSCMSHKICHPSHVADDSENERL